MNQNPRLEQKPTDMAEVIRNAEEGSYVIVPNLDAWKEARSLQQKICPGKRLNFINEETLS